MEPKLTFDERYMRPLFNYLATVEELNKLMEKYKSLEEFPELQINIFNEMLNKMKEFNDGTEINRKTK
jgi:hypothetical protein